MSTKRERVKAIMQEAMRYLVAQRICTPDELKRAVAHFEVGEEKVAEFCVHFCKEPWQQNRLPAYIRSELKSVVVGLEVFNADLLGPEFAKLRASLKQKEAALTDEQVYMLSSYVSRVCALFG